MKMSNGESQAPDVAEHLDSPEIIAAYLCEAFETRSAAFISSGQPSLESSVSKYAIV